MKTIIIVMPKPTLTVEQVLAWADAHKARMGRWPSALSGPVIGVPGETWGALETALREGHHGLPGGDCLARLLAASAAYCGVAGAARWGAGVLAGDGRAGPPGAGGMCLPPAPGFKVSPSGQNCYPTAAATDVRQTRPAPVAPPGPAAQPAAGVVAPRRLAARGKANAAGPSAYQGSAAASEKRGHCSPAAADGQPNRLR
jgi:hypothetical protein